MIMLAVIWLIGVFGFCLGLIGGYLLGTRGQDAPEPQWRTDTVDGAIEWANAALDARKEKL